jgi:hypothetical protein
LGANLTPSRPDRWMLPLQFLVLSCKLFNMNVFLELMRGGKGQEPVIPAFVNRILSTEEKQDAGRTAKKQPLLSQSTRLDGFHHYMEKANQYGRPCSNIGCKRKSTQLCTKCVRYICCTIKDDGKRVWNCWKDFHTLKDAYRHT